ncbi:MFS transporter [Glutamicibacter sp. X7]
MLRVLSNRQYAKLFTAQIVALLGTGLLTVALGLLAYDLAGAQAGSVLGVALSIKMLAYVFCAPLIAAWIARLPRKAVMITADLLRAAVALCLPFVGEVWQIYVLIFVLQSASATFTPTFQALIPSILPEEQDYTRALSLSRLAYDLEALLSPLLAAALLSVLSYSNLFLGTVAGFLLSAILVTATNFPLQPATPPGGFVHRLTRGIHRFGRSKELRGLLGLNLTVAAASSMVLINTVVLVRGNLALGQVDVALLLAAYGAGSMCIALSMPGLLGRFTDRRVMLLCAGALPVLLLAAAAVIGWGRGSEQWLILVVLWVLFGAATSGVLTPSARLLRRNASSDEHPAVFAAQFSLSHACFLLCYPLAGVLGARIGLSQGALVLAVCALLGVGFTVFAWASLSRSRPPVASDSTQGLRPGEAR